MPYPHKPRKWRKYSPRQKRAWYATRGWSRKPRRKRRK